MRTATDLSAAEQAALAAELAKLMGWAERSGGAEQPFSPWTDARDAVALADWAEREGKIDHWGRFTIPPREAVDGATREIGVKHGRWEFTERASITADRPFAFALTLCVSRALAHEYPSIRQRLQGNDA